MLRGKGYFTQMPSLITVPIMSRMPPNCNVIPSCEWSTYQLLLCQKQNVWVCWNHSDFCSKLGPRIEFVAVDPESHVCQWKSGPLCAWGWPWSRSNPHPCSPRPWSSWSNTKTRGDQACIQLWKWLWVLCFLRPIPRQISVLPVLLAQIWKKEDQPFLKI